VSIVLFYVLFVCKCILYYCHRASTQLQLNISYHIKSYHIIYRIVSHHIIYHIISYIISYYIISYYIILYHIISYHISYHIQYIISYIISRIWGAVMQILKHLTNKIKIYARSRSRGPQNILRKR